MSFLANNDDDGDDDDDDNRPTTDVDADDLNSRIEGNHRPLVSTPPSAHPRMRHPSSNWRPSFDQDADPSVKILHLGTHFEPYKRDGHSSAGRARPMSAHSMRTLPRGSALLNTAPGQGQRSSPLKPRSADLDDGGTALRNEHQDVEENTGSRYGTVASYRSAHEGQGSDEQGDISRNEGGKDTIESMWNEREEADDLEVRGRA